jgi:2'-5' RNA ligase
MRLFAAIVPPREAIEGLDEAVQPVRDGNLSWTLTSSWHLTLAFYGEVANSDVDQLSTRLARAARRYPYMRLRLSGAGRFSKSVLWAGVAGDVEPLRRLAASAAAGGRRMGLNREESRRYRPHVTLARSSHGLDLRPYAELLREFDGAEWTATDVALIRSHLGAGPGRSSTYETLATFPLSVTR